MPSPQEQRIDLPARMIRAQGVQLVADRNGDPVAVCLGDEERAAFVASAIVTALNKEARDA